MCGGVPARGSVAAVHRCHASRERGRGRAARPRGGGIPVPTEADTLVSYIVKLYNARKYQEVLKNINIAEARGMRIGQTMKNIMERQLGKTL